MSTDRETWVALSALQHLLYCERQAALIHVERQWREDVNTASGRLLHERVDLPGHDARLGRRVERAVLLGSQRLRVSGRADMVEYQRDAKGAGWRPFPVEVKRGRRKAGEADRVQLCAQALCLRAESRKGRSSTVWSTSVPRCASTRSCASGPRTPSRACTRCCAGRRSLSWRARPDVTSARWSRCASLE